MAIASPLTQGKNALNIYDKDFDDMQDYQIRLTDKDFCYVPIVVDVEGVSFCNDNAKLTFVLPCLNRGNYIMQVLERDTQEIIHEFNSIYL